MIQNLATGMLNIPDHQLMVLELHDVTSLLVATTLKKCPD